jgi:shikimate kinase
LRVSLVGVSCVGTTTIGRIFADRRGWPFFDLDDEIERHFGTSIERLQARFLTGYSYRKECASRKAQLATVVHMSLPFRHRTTKKESRRPRRPTVAALEERIEGIMDRVEKAGDNHGERVAVLEEYLTLARAHEGETWFDAGAWGEELADSYLALGRVDDAARTTATPPAVTTLMAPRCCAS